MIRVSSDGAWVLHSLCFPSRPGISADGACPGGRDAVAPGGDVAWGPAWRDGDGVAAVLRLVGEVAAALRRLVWEAGAEAQSLREAA